MPGSIVPLPVLSEDNGQDGQRPEPPAVPDSVVVRHGYMRMIAELRYDGPTRPGCGQKMVIRTNRGIELAEMVTTTCQNAGCASAVSRKQLLQYVENSGGRNFPFSTEGRVLRLAAPDDVAEQGRLDGRKRDILRFAKGLIQELDLPMKLVEVELLLGGERIIFHYTSEQWVDFRELVRRLAAEYQTRIEMHQVNARDEARLVADYEKCGQHCCCRQFLKVLKPVSMRSAKVQKATLDPSKISGRCGRLMCCLRYEDETYDVLRKKLPHRQTRVMTAQGAGTVLDTQILTQLVLVRLDNAETPAAYPLESIEVLPKDHPLAKRPPEPAPGAGPGSGSRGGDYRRGGRPGGGPGGPTGGGGGPAGRERRDEARRPQPGQPLADQEVESADGSALPEEEWAADAGPAAPTSAAGTVEADDDAEAPDDAPSASAVSPEELDDDQAPESPEAPEEPETPQTLVPPGAGPGPVPPRTPGQPGPPGQQGGPQGGQQDGGGRRRRRRRRRRRGGGGGGGPA